MRPLTAELIWLVGGVAWFVVRYPHQRRARKVVVARSVGGRHDQILLGCSLTGLAIVPLAYLIIRIVAGEPLFADYRFSPLQGWVGLLLMLGGVFRPPWSRSPCTPPHGLRARRRTSRSAARSGS